MPLVRAIGWVAGGLLRSVFILIIILLIVAALLLAGQVVLSGGAELAVKAEDTLGKFQVPQH